MRIAAGAAAITAAVVLLLTTVAVTRGQDDATPGGGMSVRVDSVPASDESTRYSGLTDADFRLVAEELGVEIASIKAVVEIEAGKQIEKLYIRKGDEGVLGSRNPDRQFRPHDVCQIP